MVGAFRMTGSTAPYDATVGEFVLVPVGEELLFRGFLLGTLLELFRHREVGSHSAAWAVLVSAAAFGIGHLGNLGHVETAFVILQVFAAFIFGVVAGYVRVRTESVVGSRPHARDDEYRRCGVRIWRVGVALVETRPFPLEERGPGDGERRSVCRTGHFAAFTAEFLARTMPAVIPASNPASAAHSRRRSPPGLPMRRSA